MGDISTDSPPEPDLIVIDDDDDPPAALSPQLLPPSPQDEIKQKIETILAFVVQDLATGRAPYLEIRTPQNLNHPLRKIELLWRSSQPTFTGVISLLTKCYELVNRGERQNKRDIFYEKIQLYRSQGKLDEFIKIVCAMLKVPRWELNIEASAKGLIAGGLMWQGVNNDQYQIVPGAPALIPSNQTGFHDFESDAKFILVVEKDAVFNKVLEENCFQTLGSFLLITGKGYPDYATRRFVKKLSDSLALRTFILVDADPHGVQIAATYRWGSTGCLDPETCIPNLELLGVLPSELDYLSQNEGLDERLPLTENDAKRLDAIERRIPDEGWKRELQLQRTMRTKAEIENLSTSSPNYLTGVYLRSKIARRLQLSPAESQ